MKLEFLRKYLVLASGGIAACFETIVLTVHVVIGRQENNHHLFIIKNFIS